MAKLALWLETVAQGRPLSFLDHHLRQGDSLVGATVDGLATLPGAADADADAIDLFADTAAAQLPTMLSVLQDIRAWRSETRAEVKRKEKVFADVLQKRRAPLLALADLWASTFLLPAGVDTGDGAKPIDHALYDAALREVGKPQRLGKLLARSPYAEHLDHLRRSEHRPLHWELEFPECFFATLGRTAGGRRPDAGFDAVIGNPPYDVLSERETGLDLAPLKRFIDHHARAADGLYAPSKVGKNNLYKLFVCRAWSLLRDGARMGFITPMALLGDSATRGLRQLVFRDGAIESVESFPQKDDRDKRVFVEAKLSTAIVIARRQHGADAAVGFEARVHAAGRVQAGVVPCLPTPAEIGRFDERNLTVPTCDQMDWDLAVRVCRQKRTVRLGSVADFTQGEVNETNARKRLELIEDGTGGRLVLRGSNICLYVPRPASQGKDIHLNIDRFLAGKDENTKAHDFRYPRAALQESCPQNNFRRLVATLVPADEFCNHKINYVSQPNSRVPLEVLVAVLNSKLADWYFRIGSTNAAVSHYQLKNLPFPAFAEAEADPELRERAMALVTAGRPAEVDAVLAEALAEPPFDRAVTETLVAAVRKISTIESARGAITRRQRSSLDPKAQPYQDLIDRLLFRCADLTDAEAAGLERRLATML